MLAPVLYAAFAAATILAVRYALLERRRRKNRPFIDRSPVRIAGVDSIDPVFAPGPLGYSRETEIAMIGGGASAATVSDTEAWILGVLAKRARHIFEFGTCTGRTTYILARNAPDDAEVVTITLDPGTVGRYCAADGDSRYAAKIAAVESGHTRFFYEGTEASGKVRQLIGDSKAFDERPYAGRFDLIFIDGSHALSYVKSDSKKAFRMVRPGGFIVWHDFSPDCPGVWRCVNDLGASHRIVHIRKTRLAVFRA